MRTYPQHIICPAAHDATCKHVLRAMLCSLAHELSASRPAINYNLRRCHISLPDQILSALSLVIEVWLQGYEAYVAAMKSSMLFLLFFVFPASVQLEPNSRPPLTFATARIPPQICTNVSRIGEKKGRRDAPSPP
jgi:hypothetical protein